MTAEVLTLAAAVAAEKNVSVVAVCTALEEAFASVVRKRLQASQARVQVDIDPATGRIAARRLWTVVDEVQDTQNECLPSAAIGVGGLHEEALDPPLLTRQNAKFVQQAVLARLKDIGRSTQAQAWSDKIGTIVYGPVVRQDPKGGTWIALPDGCEAFLGRSECIRGEQFRVGQRVRALLLDADPKRTGTLVLSRRHPSFLEALLTQEVPEIQEGWVKVVMIAREAGQRSKIALEAAPGFTGDPIAACIGMRGSRIQAITEELGGERFDLVRWDQPLPQRVVATLAPAEIERLIIDEEGGQILAAVPEERLARAIGKGGQNVRLGAQLLAMEVRIMSPRALEDWLEAERVGHVGRLEAALGTDQELAEVLVDQGFLRPTDLLAPGASTLLKEDGFDAALLEALIARAREALIEDELKAEAKILEKLALFGLEHEITSAQVDVLQAKGVATADDLADLATDELVDLTGWLEETSAALIMAARRRG